MKKKSESRIVNVFSRIINVRAWFDWERMKIFSSFVGNALRRLFMGELNDAKKEPSPALTESFNAAKNEFHLSDADLLIQEKSLRRLSALMTLLALLIFIYSGYHFIYGTFQAGAISLVIMLIALALAFRYHFWYFQIKTRKLGCSVQEWFRKGLLGEKE